MNDNSQVKLIVLDSLAVTAWLQGEAQGKIVRDLISWIEGDQEAEGKARSLVGEEVKEVNLYFNIINLGEIFYILSRRKGEREAKGTISELMATPIEIVPVTDSLVMEAASLKIKYRIAYADAFAVATAKAKNASLITGDPKLKDLDEVPILWIGKDKRQSDP